MDTFMLRSEAFCQKRITLLCVARPHRRVLNWHELGLRSPSNMAVMVTKNRSGSERVKPGSRDYLASERAKASDHGAFASRPGGLARLMLDGGLNPQP
jgi:hypothetical protein